MRHDALFKHPVSIRRPFHSEFWKLRKSQRKRHWRSPLGNLYFRKLSISCPTSPILGRERAPPSTPLLDEVCQKLEQLVDNEHPKKVRRKYGVSSMFSGNFFCCKIRSLRTMKCIDKVRAILKYDGKSGVECTVCVHRSSTVYMVTRVTCKRVFRS